MEGRAADVKSPFPKALTYFQFSHVHGIAVVAVSLTVSVCRPLLMKNRRLHLFCIFPAWYERNTNVR
jgi:hypothetical protein